ncbi:MAG: phosphate/phosphite/phosphonate ABC transporter substrate-binding protein [Firmicutes bacterium]|nr:phosphate/phosphite/phosphonate ABC transporter substrate-binding protein [Bacillota bacterium]
MKGRLAFAVCFAVLAALSAAAASRAEQAAGPDTEVVLGFVPYYNVANLQFSAEPLVQMLSRELGRPVRGFFSPNYTALVEAMGTGRVDVTFLSAFTYVLARERHGAQVLLTVVRNGNTHYRSQIIVRSDSPIRTLEDLRGRTFAFGDYGSSSGYLYPAAFLKQHGIDPERDLLAVSLGQHDAVVQAVLMGDADAGATFEDAHILLFSDEYPDIDERLRKLAVTDDIPYDTITARPGLPPELAEAIIRAFERIAATDEGRRVLQELYRIDGVVRARDEDYDVVRRTAELMGIREGL